MSNILLVYALGGPPLDLVVQTLSKRCRVSCLLAVEPAGAVYKYLKSATELVGPHYPSDKAGLVERIVKAAREVKADAIISFSEFAIEAVALACEQLGLKGPGLNVARARDKLDMRAAWRDIGVYQPDFQEVTSVSDLRDAMTDLGAPLVLKVANGAGSIGQKLIEPDSDLDLAFASVRDAIDAAISQSKFDLSTPEKAPRFIAETVIPSTTSGWYDEPGLGDYLSVEGLVANGQYHPLAITARMPTIPPFIETTNFAPCPLPVVHKQKIVNAATVAVNALELENCATHTELKLMPGGEIGLIETSARMGGVAIAKELHSVFGIDYIDLLLDVLLHENPNIPAFEADAPKMAAASLSIIGADSVGHPWRTERYFEHGSVNWKTLAGPNLDVQVEPFQSIAQTDPVPPYRDANGVLTNAGIAFVSAPDVSQLVNGLVRIMDGLEHHLPRVSVDAVNS